MIKYFKINGIENKCENINIFVDSFLIKNVGTSKIIELWRLEENQKNLSGIFVNKNKIIFKLSIIGNKINTLFKNILNYIKFYILKIINNNEKKNDDKKVIIDVENKLDSSITKKEVQTIEEKKFDKLPIAIDWEELGFIFDDKNEIKEDGSIVKKKVRFNFNFLTKSN